MEEIARAVAVYAIPLLFAVTLHEVAHGWVAEKCGDPTARVLGRITLNPASHIDPVGTILVPFLLLITKVGIIFGWARPVPVNYANLRNPRRDGILVSLAGPGSNFLQFALWFGVIVVVRAAVGFPPVMEIVPEVPSSRFTVPLFQMAVVGMNLNLLLGVFNLIPIVPLDGGRVMHELMPRRWAAGFGRIEPYGILLVAALWYFFGEWLRFVYYPTEWFLDALFS